MENYYQTKKKNSLLLLLCWHHVFVQLLHEILLNQKGKVLAFEESFHSIDLVIN